MEWCNKPATSYAVHWVDPKEVNPPYTNVPIKADETYVRVTLVEMMLAKSTAWFHDVQPSVQGLTRCKFGDQTIEIPSLAAPDGKQFPQRAVLRNFRLLDLIPFRGNSIEITTALVSIAGDDKLANGIKALSNVASLFSPPLGSALTAAEKLRDSIAMLAGDQSGVHLAYHNTFTAEPGGSQLQSGYLAIVGAAASELENVTPFVTNDSLALRTANGPAPVGYDYMLLRFEVLANRDDMENFSDIAAQRELAIASLLHDTPPVADLAYRTALSTILLHKGLTNADRRVVATALKTELDGLKATLGTRAAPPRAWKDVVKSLPLGTDHSPVHMHEFIR